MSFTNIECKQYYSPINLHIRLDLAFSDKAIREACEKEAIAQIRYGVDVAKSLKDRLTDLLVADWIEDIPEAPIFFLDGEEPRYRINLEDGFYIVLTYGNLRPPTLGDGSINWEKVRKIKVLTITK